MNLTIPAYSHVSLSSHLAKSLKDWRNPSSDDYFQTNSVITTAGRIFTHITKVLLTELALFFLFEIEAVEMVAHFALAFITTAFSKLHFISEKTADHCVERFISILFTASWTFAALFGNLLLHPNFNSTIDIENIERSKRLLQAPFDLPTHIRNKWNKLHELFPIGILLNGISSRHKNLLRSIQNTTNQPLQEHLIPQGTAFAKELLESETPETIAQIRTMSTDERLKYFTNSLPYFLAKTLFSYTLGDRKDHAFPPFFKEKTRDIIATMRTVTLSEKAQTTFRELIAKGHEKLLDSKDTPLIRGPVLNTLYEELEEGQWLSSCWIPSLLELTLSDAIAAV